MRQKLMFPNKNRNDEESKEQDAQLEQENAKLREHIELLREEERLEKEKEKRAKKKKRRLTEAQVKKELRKKDDWRQKELSWSVFAKCRKRKTPSLQCSLLQALILTDTR